MFKSAISTVPTIGDLPRYKEAKVNPLGETIRVIVGSDELIFGESYVSGMFRNRVVKFRQSALEYLHE
jgi:hypothetical protein